MNGPASAGPADRPRVIVFVHGLWFTGHEAFWLRRRLAHELAAAERNFRYRSMAATLSESAAALGDFVARIGAGRLDLVGHSLGGIVILKMLENPPPLPPGRAVLLGPPVHGSRAAQGLARWPGGRRLLGRAIAEAVLAPRPHAAASAREIGVIAGRARFGLGRLVARLDGPNDGVVLVEETRLLAARDHVVIDVHHSGMLFSRTVAAQAAAFLESGRFLRAA